MECHADEAYFGGIVIESIPKCAGSEKMATRDTSYAKELKTAVFAFPEGSEARLERLLIKETDTEEIRFSWWKDNRMMMRPLDLTESELLSLLREAIKLEVFSPEFISELRRAILNPI